MHFLFRLFHAYSIIFAENNTHNIDNNILLWQKRGNIVAVMCHISQCAALFDKKDGKIPAFNYVTSHIDILYPTPLIFSIILLFVLLLMLFFILALTLPLILSLFLIPLKPPLSLISIFFRSLFIELLIIS